MQEPINVHKVFAGYFKGCEALAYALSSKLAEGNICIDIQAYKQELPLLLKEQKEKESYSEDDARFWVSPGEFEKQCEPGTFVTHSGSELKPFVILNGKAYLHRYFQYETQIIENINRLGDKLHIITGGPGTGKTYSVAQELCKLLKKNKGLKVALAAPTGKAAARMNEAIRDYLKNTEDVIEEPVKEKLEGLKALTIHRLLGYIPDSMFFKYNKDHRLSYEVVVFDECSMIDGALMAKLLDAIDENTGLYLVGDKDQLASVEAGSVFGDICRSKDTPLLAEKIKIMEHNWRFDKNEGIGKFSKEVIEGTFKDTDNFAGDKNITIDIDYDEDLFKENALKYMQYIEEADIKEALRKLNNVRFLCVTREHDNSVAEINKKIEKLLKYNIRTSSVFNPKEGFYENQPVIITRNDYALGVFNGDVGLIRKDGEVLYAYFEASEGEIKKIQAGYINHYDTVFAMTVHKSQGSEFDNVVLILPKNQGNKLLTRELLYTGVTRAKKSVLLQASAGILQECVERSVSRASGLEKRLKA